MERPTLKYCPPRSKRFIELMESVAPCVVAYSIKQYPLCLLGTDVMANSQLVMGPKASKTLLMSS